MLSSYTNLLTGKFESFCVTLLILLKGDYNSVGVDGIYSIAGQYKKKESSWERKYFTHLKAMAVSLGITRQRVLLASLQLFQHQLPLLVITQLINDALNVNSFYYTEYWKLTHTLP